MFIEDVNNVKYWYSIILTNFGPNLIKVTFCKTISVKEYKLKFNNKIYTVEKIAINFKIVNFKFSGVCNWGFIKACKINV